MSDLDFDFGFTAVTEEELDVVKKTQDSVNDAEKLATNTKDTLDKLYNAIVPLLTNLKKNHYSSRHQNSHQKYQERSCLLMNLRVCACMDQIVILENLLNIKNSKLLGRVSLVGVYFVCSLPQSVFALDPVMEASTAG